MFIEQTKFELQNEVDQTKHRYRQLEQQICEKDQSKESVDLLVEQYRQQLTTEKELRLSKKTEEGEYSNFHLIFCRNRFGTRHSPIETSSTNK